MTHQITQDQEERLVQAALAGLSRSYAPYSHFHVSAALLCGDGTIYTGNNIENAAYSATVCAERCAFFQAVGAGKRDFAAIAVCGGRDGAAEDFCPPCGVCRQALAEFCAGEMPVILVKSLEETEVYRLEELFPLAFSMR